MLKKPFYILLGLFFLTAGCTRDDICTEETPKTPLLIIRFYNAENPNLLKPVEDLAVFADTISVSLFPVGSTDSIAIPLLTNRDFTDYIFLKNANDTLTFLAESVRFSYIRENEYINRACAFRTNYYGLDYEKITENPLSEWIEYIDVRTDSLIPQNQNEAHIRIYH